MGWICKEQLNEENTTFYILFTHLYCATILFKSLSRSETKYLRYAQTKYAEFGSQINLEFMVSNRNALFVFEVSLF